MVLSSAKLKNFQCEDQQILRDMQRASTGWRLEVAQICGDGRNHNGPRAHREHVLNPLQHRQQLYDEPPSDDEEDYA